MTDKCWCGEVATYRVPVDIAVTNPTTTMSDGQPGLAVCDAHMDRDGYEPIDDAYEAYMAELDRMCGRTVTFAGPDPYGATCELDSGHLGAHRSPNPFGGEGHYEWTGGGYCAGDPLPFRGRFVA